MSRLTRVLGGFGARWRALDRGWQAVCLGLGVVALVALGVRVPA